MKISIERKDGTITISFSEKEWSDLRSANGRLRTVKTEELRKNGGRHTVHHDVPAGCTAEEKAALKLEVALRMLLPIGNQNWRGPLGMDFSAEPTDTDTVAEIRSNIAEGVAKKAAADKKAASAAKGTQKARTGVAK